MPSANRDDAVHPALRLVQGHVFRRIEGHRHSEFVFADHSDPSSIHDALRELRGFIRSAADVATDPSPVNLAIGFTHSALRSLQITYTPLGVRADQSIRNGSSGAGSAPRNEADPFAQGMQERQELLGDQETESWSGAERGLLIWISATDAAGSEVGEVNEIIDTHFGPDRVHREHGTWAPLETKDPDELLLGYSDGVSQPFVSAFYTGHEDQLAGGGTVTSDGWKPVPLGEFVLGELDAGGTREAPGPGWLTRNGTFVVYRKYLVHRRRFDDWLTVSADRVAAITGEPSPSRADLAAKLMGRYQAASRPDEQSDAIIPTSAGISADDWHDRATSMNDFTYSGDTTGYLCPLGAHIRRANPRDALGFDGDLVERHRIIRRGSIRTPEPGGDEQELHFVGVNARIADGFEFIQRQWFNTGTSFRIGGDPDVFVGARPEDRPDDSISFTVQGDRPATMISHEPLATLVGGDYYLMPGIPGLDAIVSERS